MQRKLTPNELNSVNRAMDAMLFVFALDKNIRDYSQIAYGLLDRIHKHGTNDGEPWREPVPELPVDTKVEVLIGGVWHKRYLSEVVRGGVNVFLDGCTSWSTQVFDDNGCPEVAWYRTWQVWKDDNET